MFSNRIYITDVRADRFSFCIFYTKYHLQENRKLFYYQHEMPVELLEYYHHFVNIGYIDLTYYPCGFLLIDKHRSDMIYSYIFYVMQEIHTKMS